MLPKPKMLTSSEEPENFGLSFHLWPCLRTWFSEKGDKSCIHVRTLVVRGVRGAARLVMVILINR